MHQLSRRCANWLDVALKIVSVQSSVCLQKRSCPFNSQSQQAVNRKWLQIKGWGFKAGFCLIVQTFEAFLGCYFQGHIFSVYLHFFLSAGTSFFPLFPSGLQALVRRTLRKRHRFVVVMLLSHQNVSLISKTPGDWSREMTLYCCE